MCLFVCGHQIVECPSSLFTYKQNDAAVQHTVSSVSVFLVLLLCTLPTAEAGDPPQHSVYSLVRQLMRRTGFVWKWITIWWTTTVTATHGRALSYREAVLCFTLTVHIDADSVEIFHFLTGCNRPGSRHRVEITWTWCGKPQHKKKSHQ